ncbi:CcdC family protein [Bacillus sp. V59.32b]|uniref:CcdC family protein n=1 Tax=Bacillus sp. V59.32b TaxID=1758642 RepID=UPI000E3C2205|nr:cytochrome c biogenesis protein CcdC [Bacillus sp. V59.32b]RFU68370.1 cytochrome c biogenesis protein CcdC [Bacillus sp. V59.32b]
MVYISSAFAILMAIMALVIRMKASARPVSTKKIILPPLFMSTGALMFLFPVFRVTPLKLLEAVTVGLIFSIFLIKTSNFEVRDDQIYLRRSKAFAFILIGLLVIRIAAKLILSSSIDLGELSGMFFLLAFAMIVPWRISMLMKYRKLKNGCSDMNFKHI